MCMQGGPLSPSSLSAIPEGPDGNSVSDGLKTHSPFSVTGGSDVAYLAHTSTEVLELQVPIYGGPSPATAAYSATDVSNA